MAAMRRSIIIDYAVMLLLALVLSACARPEENAATSNSNAAGQANSNSASTQGPPDSMTPSPGTPLVVQQLPAPPAKPPDAATQPAAKPTGDKAVGSAERAPKLVAPEKRVDFGKQPQDKNLIRAIAIRNGGRADLKIESVVPS
ncbi:MAG TPA: hypothetical protein VLM38_09080 [Blastocatellia bacterium]|nr:hypothetical protein [Blastocatellia bacterium]